jgi:hypothetical protein
MTSDELIAEGVALARPCFLLSTSKSGRLAGFWRGERRDKPNTVPAIAKCIATNRHIITVDGALLAELGLAVATPVDLFEMTDVSGREIYRVERNPSPKFSEISCTGEPLYATPSESFPPLEAVCLYGSRMVADWLRGLGLARHQYDAVRAKPIAERYVDEFTRRAPFYVSGAAAILGGWHMSWPEDDFFMPMEMRLIITTMRDAEPFFEVWLSAGNNCSVKSRIT